MYTDFCRSFDMSQFISPPAPALIVEKEKLRKGAKGTHQISPLLSLVAGGIAGGVEATATVRAPLNLKLKNIIFINKKYPTEFLKTRSQLRADGVTEGIVRTFQTTVRNEGFGALYTGCSTLVIGTAFKASVRFLTFDTIKSALVESNGKLSTGNGILAGVAAGCVESVVAVTPTERLKTALIDDSKKAKRFNSSAHAVRLILQEQGARGLYKGLVSTTMKQSATSGVRMGSYNQLKEISKSRNLPQNSITTFATGAVAGIITVYATQPFDTIKTRTQSAKGAKTMEASRSILQEYGARGFWKGSTMRLSRLVFSGGIVFSVYEQIVSLVKP